MMWCKVVVTLVLLSVYMCSLITDATADPYWQSPGCHLVGYREIASASGCHMVAFQMNACRGYCLSYSSLSPYGAPGDKLYETRGSCCSIRSTHDVIVILQCEDNKQLTQTYKSAATCDCSLCSHDS
ncbi:thyrostimulin alpha-2 subunit-like [Patiria miniata]|uniref:CTCK domain-containing protein n=1 Tax=Patiria miniata TaxID=46514 RepID=A0A914BD86_PATMI|nr:thyrostimulin alpha-2 subunit-like [Patiria miniata]XP_038073390.1 thyrostimulin alpha-2 subunit-like [Patiria miniata]XP_038073392.1 thyrostimulin alpha-2 subunit-like [Patiria miniata]XP_038073393.1 thyrostimulin alpha-2 subunit-like [Patiria miniata]